MRDDIMRVKEDFCHFLAEMSRDGINPGNVEMLSAAAVGAEKIMKMAVLEEELMGGGGYSQEGRYSGDGGYSGGYDDGDSYRRGRDSRGRYTRDGGYSMDNSGYSNEGGNSYGRHWVRGHYSRDNEKQHMIEQMRRMAEQASPEERKVIEKTIRNMEQA